MPGYAAAACRHGSAIAAGHVIVDVDGFIECENGPTRVDGRWL
jgi:hypothetical protein